MTHNTKEELERLFKLAVPLAKEFNKRTYSDLFQSKYEEFKPLFDAIERECAEADNPGEAVEEVASVIPDAMHQILEKAGSKRKKEQILMNYNMGMVSFIIPMMRYGRTPVCEKVVDRMIVLWNDNGLEMDLGKSSYEDIEGGFKARMCYITTAVCEGLGKPDHCYELETLRNYRDGYLANSEGGMQIIREYYDIAPTIVKRLGRSTDAGEVYLEIWKQYLEPCVRLIEDGKPAECKEVYTDMVRTLKTKSLYS